MPTIFFKVYFWLSTVVKVSMFLLIPDFLNEVSVTLWKALWNISTSYIVATYQLHCLTQLSGKEKSPQLDDGGSGLPPRDDDDGGGGGGGGGGNWSGGFFFFGFLAFLGFIKDKESEDTYRDKRRRWRVGWDKCRLCLKLLLLYSLISFLLYTVDNQNFGLL